MRLGGGHPALAPAKRRLDSLGWWPRPVRIEHVRVVHAPWLFRLPFFRRFDGYATHVAIFLRNDYRPGVDDDLVTHELCHVWQMQHRPVRMPLSYLRGYEANAYEQQARRAAAATASRPGG
jgi:hypothetical protein